MKKTYTTINIDRKPLPTEAFFKGKPYKGEVVFIQGYNGYTRTADDGLMCTLINNSCWNRKRSPNVITNAEGRVYHSIDRDPNQTYII